jgi:hypothetical protein
MKIAPTLLLASALFIGGCATAYQPNGYTGGFSETKLAPDVVRVVFTGNGYTSKQRAQDLALLRAAELSLAAGSPYFAVLSESTDVRHNSVTTSGTSYTTGSAYVVGNQAYYSGQTIHSPGQTMNFYHPESGILIKFLKEKPTNALVFDATFLVGSLKEKYKIR